MTAQDIIPHRTGPSLVHVAAAGENRGRILLLLRSATPGRLATTAAIELAKTFDARIESIFIEESEIFAAAAHGFSCEVGLNGKRRGVLDCGQLETQYRAMAYTALRSVATASRHEGIPVTTNIQRGDIDRILKRACNDIGPWNIIVLDAQCALPRDDSRTALLDGGGATAFIAIGPKAIRTSGPKLLLLSEPDRLGVLQRTARRIAEIEGEAVPPPLLALASPVSDDTALLESLVRLAVAGMNPRTAPILLTDDEAMPPGRDAASIGHHLNPGLIITHNTTGDEADAWLAALIQNAECPVMIVR